MPVFCRPSRTLLLSLAMAGGGACVCAHADTRLDFSGFGTLGVVKSNSDELESNYGYAEPDRLDWDWRNVLGIQADLTSTSGFGLTAQAVARGNTNTEEERYQPVTEWFFGSWQLQDSLRLRAGRLRSPLFLHSDTLEVGYSYPWASLPDMVYSTLILGASHFDGADLTYTQITENALIEYHLAGGSSETSNVGNTVKIDAIKGIAVSADFDSFIVRYGLSSYTTTVESPLLAQAQAVLLAFQPQSEYFADLAEAIDTYDVPYRLQSLSFSANFSNYTLTAEAFLISTDTENRGSVYSASHMTLSRQTGKHTFWAIAQQTKSDLKSNQLENLAATNVIVHPGQNAVLDLVRQGVAPYFDSFTLEGRGIGAGYRYDLTETWDVKVQANHARYDNQTNAAAYITPPDRPEHPRSTTFTFTTDWVF